MRRSSEDLELSETRSFLSQHEGPIQKPKGRFQKLFKVSGVAIYALSVLINIITVTYLVHLHNEHLDFGGEVNSITPRFSQELIKFEPELEVFTTNYTSSEALGVVRQRWQDLLPRGGGDVHIPNHKKYDRLSEPWIDAHGNTLWKVSWAHQLHCLYYLMDAFDKVIRYGSTGDEAMVEEGHHSVHTKHCYDYLRQAILCNADMTLEGRTLFDNTGGTDGFGHTHVCRNKDEATQWAEDHRVKDKRFIIDPEAPL